MDLVVGDEVGIRIAESICIAGAFSGDGGNELALGPSGGGSTYGKLGSAFFTVSRFVSAFGPTKLKMKLAGIGGTLEEEDVKAGRMSNLNKVTFEP